MGGVSYTSAWSRFDGYHSVPNVNRNSAENFELNLGNLEKPWDDNNVLALFCDSSGFLSASCHLVRGG